MRSMMPRQKLRSVAVFLSCLLPLQTLGAPVEPVLKLQIVVLEGNGAINNIEEGRARDPIVVVQSQTGQPVPGAIVTFSLPTAGPGGEFPDGQSVLVVMTDEKGQAAARGLRPNKIPGQFEIRANASYQGQTAAATLTQTNAAPIAVVEEGGSSKRALLIGILAAAAAGGALAATRGGGAGAVAPPSVSSPSVTISPGSPTFGPPR